jgi:hypothetical protein
MGGMKILDRVRGMEGEVGPCQEPHIDDSNVFVDELWWGGGDGNRVWGWRMIGCVIVKEGEGCNVVVDRKDFGEEIDGG